MEEKHLYCTQEMKDGELCGKKVFQGEYCKIHFLPTPQDNWKDWEQIIRKDLVQFPVPLPKFTEELISSIKQILSSQAHALKERMKKCVPEERVRENCECNNEGGCGCEIDTFNDCREQTLSAIESIEI